MKNCSCPLTGAPLTLKTAIGALIAFVIIQGMMGVWHNVVMGDMYQATAHLWLPQEDMKFGLMTLAFALIAFFLTTIFQQAQAGGKEHASASSSPCSWAPSTSFAMPPNPCPPISLSTG